MSTHQSFAAYARVVTIVCGGVATPRWRSTVNRFHDLACPCSGEETRTVTSTHELGRKEEKGVCWPRIEREGELQKEREGSGEGRKRVTEWEDGVRLGRRKRENQRRYWCACLLATTRTSWTRTASERGDRLYGEGLFELKKHSRVNFGSPCLPRLKIFTHSGAGWRRCGFRRN